MLTGVKVAAHVMVLYQTVQPPVSSSPKDVAEKQGSIVPKGPVVVERVDGGCQRLQDAVHNTGDKAAHVRAQIQVGVLDQTLNHVEKPVELLQVMANRLHLVINNM